ncbi:MAG: reverse transcriptase domain-containing protein, partial [Bacteroidota bacterium]
MEKAKSFNISKHVVWEAYQKVKANQGAAGVDAESIADFEVNLKDNLYKIWNRMSSGTYFPPPVRAVEIPKKTGGVRILGVPTVSDRIAQMVAKMYLEPLVEPHFLEDSYGYRPKKSAIQAVEVTRKRCWRYDWLLEYDIRGLFDNIDHSLLLRALRKHTDCKWLLLYIERWLTAPFQTKEGELVGRTRGTPQGGVISPVLSNLFLHYVFDKWRGR